MSTFEILKKTHFVVVTIFFLIYLVKTILLLANKKEQLQSFTKKIKVIEMIVSFLFLGTGIYLMTQIPEIKMELVIKISMVFLSIPLAVIGFKKGNKGLAVFSFLLIIAAFGLAEMSAKKNSAKVTNTDLNSDGSINAKQLYTDNCAKCHGDDGKAGIMGSTDLTTTQLSSDSISNLTEKGRKNMPATVGLTIEQRKAISQYILDNIKGK
ncbi:MAG TPA: cytochrome c [Bacteroidia bacterium]|jgi:mono/diheme cytochrome c family protein|nr:cytochrome c [Bacteroidia bacterium]